MRWVRLGYRFAALALACLCPLLAGCVGSYVYPTAQFIPPTRVGSAARDEVHAFRVDIVDYTGSFDLSNSDEYFFREVPLDARGNVSALWSARFGRGWFGNWIAHRYRQRLHPTIRLRLYRPGFETVEVKPWHWTGGIVWKRAATLEAREQAVDDLIATKGTNDLYSINPAVWEHDDVGYSLAEPKTESQRMALRFVADEYQRLEMAARNAGDTTAAARLADKSRQVRDLAEAPEERNSKESKSP